MRGSVTAILVLILAMCAVAPATAQEGTADPAASLTPLEQLEEMKRQFDEAVRASQQSTATPQDSASDSSASETIRTLRLQVQDLTYENAQLLESSAQAANEASETAAALVGANAVLQTQVANLEQQVAELQTEVDEKRPLFWRDPADWAAILGGLAAGALLGVVLSSRRRGGRSQTVDTTPTIVAPPAGELRPDGAPDADRPSQVTESADTAPPEE